MESRREQKMSDRELMYQHFQADLDFQQHLMEDIKIIKDKLDEDSDTYILRKYVPILEAWEGLSFGKKVLLGTGTIATAIAAVGAVVWWLWVHIKT